MKKDIEWLKNRLKQTIKFDALNDKEIGFKIAMDEVLILINQLDEPEVLSLDWIDDNKKDSGVHYIGYYVPIGRLYDLLVPKQEVTEEHGMSESEWAEVINRYKWHLKQEGYVVIEKPTIPNFVAEHIKSRKGETLAQAYNISTLTKVGKWLLDKENCETFAKAWLYGFTVQKEHKYYALIKGHENIGSDDKYWNYCITDESLDIGDNKVHADVLAEYVLSATKDKWENLGINDDNADFVLVEELEE